MTMLRVRVEVADVPGALAGITTALASLGVDVAAIDVLEVDAVTVVDEMLLRLPAGVTAQEVRDVLRVAGAAEVLSVGVTSASGDAAVRAFDLARAVLTSRRGAVAGEALARVAYADEGMLIGVDAARRFPLAQRALDTGVPASGPAGADASPLEPSSGWVLWVAPALPEPTQLAVVARRMNVRFSATEAARLRAFTTLLAAMDRAPA